MSVLPLRWWARELTEQKVTEQYRRRMVARSAAGQAQEPFIPCLKAGAFWPVSVTRVAVRSDLPPEYRGKVAPSARLNRVMLSKEPDSLAGIRPFVRISVGRSATMPYSCR